jgi:squalene synthase HpnC
MTQLRTFSDPAGGIALAEAGHRDLMGQPMALRALAGIPAPPSPLIAGPETVRMAFAPAADAAAARLYTHKLAHSHYENFSVVSFLLPRRLRQDFCNVYAFCRTADDLADEVRDRSTALDCLAAFRDQARAMYDGVPTAAIFVALAETVHRHNIPVTPFLDLIDAFEQDQRVSRYETFEQVVDYCRRSADPVGRLVLYMCGYSDAERQRLSDKTCTALQLANFWQDIRRDFLDRDRIYVPIESMRRFGLDEQRIRDGIVSGKGDAKFRDLIRFEVERTEAMFAQGSKLTSMLAPSVRGQVGLFADGGMAILRAIRRQGFDTLARRPVLSRSQKGRLVCSALAAALTANLCDVGAFVRKGVPRRNGSALHGKGRPGGIGE